MSQHEKFEAAWSAEYPVHGPTAFKRSGFKPDAYVNTRVNDGWLMWQASRRAALEEAAKVCEEMADGWNQTAQGATDGRYDFMAEAGDRCSDEIRALTKETNNG